MSPFTVNHRFVTGRRAQRGQTLIVALAILFLLLFIGGLFVTRIGRNLVFAGRSRDQSDATQLAQAGLDYCNKQLNETPEGADWRPTPTPPISNGDPDYYYLEKGFTRLPLNGGRALVRVAYDPHPTNPLGQALRIESVGLPGELPPGGSDPTIFVINSNASRLRKELVAYKQFGIIDYGHFYTNKDHRTISNYIGTPNIGSAVATVLGNPMLGYSQYANGLGKDGEVLYGFPIRSNSDVTLGDDTYLYLSPRGQDPSLQQENLLVYGSLNLLSEHRTQIYTSVNDTLYPAYLNQEIDIAPVDQGATSATGAENGHVIRGTNDVMNGFDAFNGIVRDNSLTPDANGAIRAVPYLTPPSIDTLADNTSLTRYRTLTMNSGYFYTAANGQASNTGQFGYGTGIYINNTTDLQPETKTPGLNGAYSQRADWLNPNAGFGQGFWNGPFYRPPGVLVELLGDTIRITRSDGQSFVNADGTVNPNGDNTTLTIPLADAARNATTLFTRSNGTVVSLPVLSKDGDTANNPNSPFGDKNSYGVNLVLFAEGNIRVRGVYGAITNPATASTTGPQLGRVHITLVTNGTAYIEGSLVRGDGYLPQGQTQPIMERASTCAVLAEDYICLNTTLFMQPMTQTSVWNRQSPDLNIFTNEMGQSEQRYDTGFMWGVDPSTYTTNGQPNAPVYLMLRHGVLSPGPAAINLLINPGLSNADLPAGQPGSFRNSLYLFNEYGPNPQGQVGNPTYLSTPETYLLGVKFPEGSTVGLTDGDAVTPYFEQKAFPLNALLHNMPVDYNTTNSASGSLPFILQPGFMNVLRFQMDQTAGALFAGLNGTALDTAGLQDYLLGAVMVAPLDVRIEAALYAQERSFFIIPGYALNPDASDTRQTYIAHNNVRVSYSQSPIVDSPEDKQLKDIYPFYNEPMDVRITVFGSIAENYAASQSDQQAWMTHWGFIPEYYGSTQYTSQLTVPDDHLMVHDPYNATYEYSNLVPGLDTTLDYRTPLESLPTTAPTGVNAIPSDMNPYRITRGLRTMYDPAFAMPYFHPTDNTLSPDSDAAYMARKQRALRSITTMIQVPNGGSKYSVVQVLPPIPRMPMCPDYVYAGESDRLIGSNRYDTDSIPIQ